MPKRLSEATLSDILHLRPLTQAIKTWRYRRIDRHFFALPPASGDPDALRTTIAGRNLLCTIAFEDPEGLAMHAALVRRHVTHDCHLIADNSRSPAAAEAIRLAAAQHGALYLRLPANPWTERNDSRSHGLAMNWVWRNIIVPGEPDAFGFLDDDMFPTAPATPFADLGTHAFIGDVREAGDRWFLWAGYCFYRFAAVRHLPLDFGLDWFIGLDTGGANWSVLYEQADRTALPRRAIVSLPALAGVPEEEARFEWRGTWLHEIGWGTLPQHRAAKRAVLVDMLRPHLAPQVAAAQVAAPQVAAAQTPRLRQG